MPPFRQAHGRGLSRNHSSVVVNVSRFGREGGLVRSSSAMRALMAPLAVASILVASGSKLIQGARSVLPHLGSKADRRSRWLRGALDRRGSNRAVVALANKTARIAWVLMARGKVYRAAPSEPASGK